jgi:hypothetical protein
LIFMDTEERSDLESFSDEDIPTGKPGYSPGEELFKPTSNVKFNPLPTTSGKCSKLKIAIVLDSTHYIAGGLLKGRFELFCSTNQEVWLGDICVELSGFEEIQGHKFENSQTFLASRIIYQGDRHRPSDAVRGPCREGYYQANKGKTVFPFSFEIPEEAPASFEFQNCAKLKYVVTGYTRFKYGNVCDTLIKSKDARILDRWDIEKENRCAGPGLVMNERKLFMGGDGTVQLESSIKSNFVTSGTNISIQIRVKNSTRKRVQGLKIAFVRKLSMLCPSVDPAEEEPVVKTLEEVFSTHFYKDKDYVFDPDEERCSIVHVPVPVKAYTVQNTSLSEVNWRISVSLSMPGLLSKDLTVDLPIRVCHPVSLEAPPLLPSREKPGEWSEMYDKIAEETPRLSRDLFSELDFGNRVIPLTHSGIIPIRTSMENSAQTNTPVATSGIADGVYTSIQARQQWDRVVSGEPKKSIEVRESNHVDVPKLQVQARKSRDSKSRPLPDIPIDKTGDLQVSGLGYYFGKALDLIEYATGPVFNFEKAQPPKIILEESAKGVHLEDSDHYSEQFVRKTELVGEPTRILRSEAKKKRKSMRQPKPLPQPKEPPALLSLKIGKKSLREIVDGMVN